MENYENLILVLLNSKTPKDAFEKIAEMKIMLQKWKDLAENSDMKPEDECAELYHYTKECLEKIIVKK